MVGDDVSDLEYLRSRTKGKLSDDDDEEEEEDEEEEGEGSEGEVCKVGIGRRAHHLPHCNFGFGRAHGLC